MRILIIEEDKRAASTLYQLLQKKKYQVDMTHDGKSGLDYALHEDYDVIITNTKLPYMNGFELISEIRRNKKSTPILVLASKTTSFDIVNGLDLGADDYVTRPYDSNELLARIRALSRRQNQLILNTIDYEDLTLDLSTCHLICGSDSVHLNYKEFEIIKLMFSNPKLVISKEDMLVKIWGYQSNATDNNVEAYMSFLRRKLDKLGSKVRITALRKIGYKLEVEE